MTPLMGSDNRGGWVSHRRETCSRSVISAATMPRSEFVSARNLTWHLPSCPSVQSFESTPLENDQHSVKRETIPTRFHFPRVCQKLGQRSLNDLSSGFNPPYPSNGTTSRATWRTGNS